MRGRCSRSRTSTSRSAGSRSCAGLLRDEAAAVLERYRALNGAIYNG